MTSIRRRLTFRLLATVLVLGVVANACLYLYVSNRLTRAYDTALAAKANAVAAMFQYDARDGLEYMPGEQDLAEFHQGEHAVYFEVWKDDGTVVARSPSLGKDDIARASPAPAALVTALPDGHRGRLMAIRKLPHVEEENGPPLPGSVPYITVAVAREPRDLGATLNVLGWALMTWALVLSVGAALAVTLAVRSGLAPLNQLAREADSIGAQSLDHRFPVGELPIELRPITQRLNALLDRLRSAFERERRFTADVAHELRTPVAELKTVAEVALKWPDDADHSRNYRETLETAVQMEGLITRLLAIARCEAGKQMVKAEELDLSEMVRGVWQGYDKPASGKRLSVTWDLPASARIISDRTMVLALVDNLFSNAAHYTPSGGGIRIAVSAEGGRTQLSVRNTCRDLSRDDLPHLFEPFWRKDASRAGGNHSGLGLMMVAAYANVLRTEVKVDLPEPHTFEVSVVFGSNLGKKVSETGTAFRTTAGNAQNLPLPPC